MVPAMSCFHLTGAPGPDLVLSPKFSQSLVPIRTAETSKFSV